MMISIVMELQQNSNRLNTVNIPNTRTIQTSIAAQKKQNIKKISKPPATKESIKLRSNISRIYKSNTLPTRLGLQPGPKVTG